VGGNKTYITPDKWMISGDVIKYQNGFFILARYETRLDISTKIPLIKPQALLPPQNKPTAYVFTQSGPISDIR
jgi:hypothetical protein